MGQVISEGSAVQFTRNGGFANGRDCRSIVAVVNRRARHTITGDPAGAFMNIFGPTTDSAPRRI
jgi:hypothetical protein